MFRHNDGLEQRGALRLSDDSTGLSHSISGRVAKFLLARAADEQITNGVAHARLAPTHKGNWTADKYQPGNG
jgi:hypothetical protein